MTITTQFDNHQYLQGLKSRAGAEVENAVKLASRKTGVDFAYLMEQAAVESNFDHTAKAKTSSASGLYQFIESTWLNMVKEHGDKHGLSRQAEAIDDNGKVSNPHIRADILALRNDPKIASIMAAEFAADNKAYLEERYNGEIGSTELYLAHFLGAGGASAFLNATLENPNAIAADVFPKAALANRNVFYDQATGRARSLNEVYSFFDQKFKYDDIAPEAPQEQEVRIAKAPLRNFINDTPFVADVAAARALGAIIEGDYSSHFTAPRQQGLGGLVNNDLSLFEQLQNRHNTLFQPSMPRAILTDHAESFANDAFIEMFANRV